MSVLLGLVMAMTPIPTYTTDTTPPLPEAVAITADPLRCDGVLEVCRSGPSNPWPAADMGALCAARSVFCRYVEARPAVVGGYRTGDIVGNRGAVTDEALWAVWDNFEPVEHNRAIKVMACESAFNPNARSPISTATGAWQWLNADWDWYTGEVMGQRLSRELRNNLSVATRVTAHRVNRENSWGAWECKRWEP